jgi:phospholipase/carboxylesterase
VKAEVRQGSTLDYLTILPDGPHPGPTCPVVICLHGFGANMYDLADLAHVLGRGYAYVFPNAPMTMSRGGGATGRAWYEGGGYESADAVALALAALDGLVRELLTEQRAVAGQAVLLGFSQGGALALRYGLPRPNVFAGIASLSGSPRDPTGLTAELPAERNQRLFIAHGDQDGLVPVEWGRNVAAFLGEQGYQPVYHEYPVGHAISPAEVAGLALWLRETLPPRT